MPRDTQDMPLYSIGQFAKLVSISVKALRYYDHEGILKPDRVDDQTGYRYYTGAQLEQAHMLKQLRFLHLPVEAMREFMLEPTPDRQKHFLDEHVRRLEEEVTTLNNRIRTITRKQQYPRSTEPHVVRVDPRPSVPMVFLHYHVSLARIEEARELAFVELRAYLARHRAEPASPPTCFYPPTDCPRDEQHRCEVYAAFETTEPVPGEGRVESGWTPGGTWYVARHHGLYEYLGDAGTAIVRRAREDGIHVGPGPSWCIHSEVFRIGPWDTPDLAQLMTDSRWLLKAESPGSVRTAR